MTPDVGELCAMGEAAFRNVEFEEAEAWYELACKSSYRDPRPDRPTRFDYLIADRFARWEQLRLLLPQRSVRRTSPDPGHVLLVQHREGRDYARTEESLWEAGAGAWQHFSFLTDHTGEGQAKTFFRALAAAAGTSGFTALTLLEDDVILAKNALDYIATTKIDDDLAFVSWFSVGRYSGPRLPPVLDCFRARDYMFNQAITFPARTVHELLASDALKNWSEPHGADRIYKDVFPDRLVAVHYPNLVQHIGGAQSLVGNNDHGPRTSPTFGQVADALDLVR